MRKAPRSSSAKPRSRSATLKRTAEKRGTDASALAAADRRARIWDLRLRGHDYRSIARMVAETEGLDRPLSTGTVHRALAAAYDERKALGEETRGQLIAQEVDRCDRYLAKLQADIEAGSVAAIKTALAVSDRRAKLLGLDAPTTLRVTDSRRPYEDRTAAELDADLADVQAQLAAARARAVH